jgi:hypothetical protein
VAWTRTPESAGRGIGSGPRVGLRPGLRLALAGMSPGLPVSPQPRTPSRSHRDGRTRSVSVTVTVKPEFRVRVTGKPLPGRSHGPSHLGEPDHDHGIRVRLSRSGRHSVSHGRLPDTLVIIMTAGEY